MIRSDALGAGALRCAVTRLLGLLLVIGGTAVSAIAEDSLVLTEVLLAKDVAAGKHGGSSSIGSDTIDIRTQTSWFYGSRPVVTCFNAIDAFGHSDDSLAQVVRDVMQLWRDYVVNKRVLVNDPNNAPNANFKFVGKCVGGEDLVIHFGTGPIFGNIQDLKAVQTLHYPVAYANKTHMTSDLRWGKGYIRLVGEGYYGGAPGAPFPSWRDLRRVRAILAHELGHVLGFLHTPDTVMSPNWVDEVFMAAAPSPVAVDGRRELIRCADCTERYRLLDERVPRLLARFGFGAQRRPVLSVSRNGMKLEDGTGQVAVAIEGVSKGEGAPPMPVLAVNFPPYVVDTSPSTTVYGHLQGKAGKLAVILEMGSGGRSNAVVLRTAKDGEIVEVARFEREAR